MFLGGTTFLGENNRWQLLFVMCDNPSSFGVSIVEEHFEIGGEFIYS